MSKSALIVMSKTSIDLSLFKSDLNIGVEKGCLSLIEHNMLDVSISDFDHVNNQEYNMIIENSKKHIKLDSNKDLIDGELAIKYALETKHDNIVCIFEQNNRVDMQISIIGLIDKYNVKFISSNSIMFKLMKNNILEYKKYSKYKYVSIFPIEDSILSVKNMKYNCEKLEIKKFTSNTFSNELIINKDGVINIDGNCIIIFSND